MLRCVFFKEKGVSMKRGVVLIVVFMLSAVAQVFAQKTGRIAGSIVDESTGAPIRGALVEIVKAEKAVISEGDGRYILSDVPPGRCTIRVIRIGFVGSTVSDVVVKAGKTAIHDFYLTRQVFAMDLIVVTAARSEWSLNQTTQNVSLITSEEIKAMPAHDVAEALNFTPGLNIQKSGGIGEPVLPSIQGASHRHVLVLLDGIPMNNQSEGLADLVQLPVENVERIEVVKGPASAVWGSSLGGVIHVISKDPGETKVPGGYVSTQFGRWNTQRHQLNFGGKVGRAGYFVSGSWTSSDGFRPKSAHEGDKAFVKLSSSLWKDAEASLLYGYTDGDTEDFEDFARRFWRAHSYTTKYGGLDVDFRPREWFEVDLMLKWIARETESKVFKMDSTDLLQKTEYDEPSTGLTIQGTAKLSHGNTLISGLDVHASTLRRTSPDMVVDQEFSEVALYVSDRQKLGDLLLTIGGRYDDNSEYGSQFSPMLGLVYNFIRYSTLIRSSVSRGFGAPPLIYKYIPETETQVPNPDMKAERVWACQAGVESHYLDHLWGKVTLYRSDITDGISSSINEKGQRVMRNFARQRRQGFELELGLEFPFGASVFAGTAFNDIRNLDEDEMVYDLPRQTYDVGIQYLSGFGLRANLKGHYVWYNANPLYGQAPYHFTSKDKRFIWDAKIAQKIPVGSTEAEVFIAAYNLLDTDFWWVTPYPLPKRWLEVGVGCTF